MSIDDSALAELLHRLHGANEEVSNVSVGLQAIVDSASSFFDVAGAGLMMIGDQGLQAAVASDEPGHVLEETQERLGQGPCVDSLVYDRIIETEDLALDERYEKLAPEVVPLGVRSVLGMPVHVNGTPAGTLNLYANEPRRWSESEIRMLHAFSGVLASVLTTAVLAHRGHVLVQQLQYALDNRVTIERAVGVTMAQRSIDAVSAFNVLRDAARADRRKVAEVAAEVLEQLSR